MTAELGKDENTLPPYTILSHTWVEGQEVTCDDLTHDTGHNKEGYIKLWLCAQQAQQDDLQYFWVDTCCIDKANTVELQHLINSIFRWYHSSVKCYVYLPDVSIPTPGNLSQHDWEPAFRKSRWFTRGWTLQELLAPRHVILYSRSATE